MSFSRKSHIVVSAVKNGLNFAATLTTETCSDDIGDPPLPLEQMIQDNPEAFAAAVVGFIVDTHPDIAAGDIVSTVVYGDEVVTYFQD